MNVTVKTVNYLIIKIFWKIVLLRLVGYYCYVYNSSGLRENYGQYCYVYDSTSCKTILTRKSFINYFSIIPLLHGLLSLFDIITIMFVIVTKLLYICTIIIW